VLVANELVTNAVVHARTDLWLQLELRGDRLFIALIDAPFNRPPARPHPRRPELYPRTATSRSSSSWTCAGPWTS
jgi:hypothetical protein